MSWNVENLFDVGDADGPDTHAQFAAKTESLRAVIDAQKPHVLALQEVGSESALGRLQAALTVPMPHRVLAAPDERGIRVGFISRRVLHDPTEMRLAKHPAPLCGNSGVPRPGSAPLRLM